MFAAKLSVGDVFRVNTFGHLSPLLVVVGRPERNGYIPCQYTDTPPDGKVSVHCGERIEIEPRYHSCEGHDACRRGVEYNDCPYPHNTPAREGWEEGWLAAHDMMTMPPQ